MPLSDEEAAILIAERDALLVRNSMLEADVKTRDAEIAALREKSSKPKARVLDPGAADPFDRPYGGG